MKPIHRLRLAGTPDGYQIAFIFKDGVLHMGDYHASIMEGLGMPGIYPGTDPYEEIGVGIFGWVWKEDGVFRAEIYSDYYETNQDVDMGNIDEMLVQLRKKYPITELTYGPDDNTIKDLSEYFDDPRLAALDYIARQTGESVL